MNGGLNILLTEAQTAEILRQASTRRMRSVNSPPRPAKAVVRIASEADDAAIERLAQLEGRGLAPGRALVAERDGEVLAAVALDGGAPIADPFRPSAELVELLGRALAHLHGDGRRRRWSLWGLLRRSDGRDISVPTVPGNEVSLIR